MELTQEQGEIFWPLYNAYASELEKWFDSYLGILKEYEAKIDQLTDDEANALMERVFELRKKRLSLMKTSYEKMAQDLGPKIAIRFQQIDSRLNLAIEINIAADVPLID